jgi:hypothetical protein
MANVLTTKEEVKKYLEDTAGTSSFDALLDAIILGVSQKFEYAANRPLFTGTRAELKNGGSSRIYLNAPPATSITSIVYAPDYDFDNGQVLGAAEYVLDPSDKKNCVYSTYGVFPGGCDSLRVIYIGGYIPADTVGTTVPEMVKQAATLQTVYLFKNRKTIGFDNMTIGEGVLTKVTNRWLLPDVLDVIRAIRVQNIY